MCELSEQIRMCYQIYLDVILTQTLVMYFQISRRKTYAHKLTSVTLLNGYSELGLSILKWRENCERRENSCK